MSKTSYIYIICHYNDGKPIAPSKIGVSDFPERRLKQLVGGNPNQLFLYQKFAIPDKKMAFVLEDAILKTSSEKKMMGEWLNIAPSDLFILMIINLKTMFALLGFDTKESDELCRLSERGGSYV